MRQVEIDDEVFAYLQSRAIPYVETPNITLRRLLGINTQNEKRVPAKDPLKLPRAKSPKTDIQRLIQSGLLEEGQRVVLHDYRGQKLTKYEAIVSGNRLLWNGKRYSMSSLAEKVLKQEGYQSNSVQGPTRWHNLDGISIKQLWDQYLNKIE